jgi:hypothetical protein
MNGFRVPPGRAESWAVPARMADLAALLLVAAFAAAGFVGLDAVPRIHVDEGWTAAPGWTLVSKGRFATDLFEGFFGAETRWYGFLPAYPAVVGLFLRLFGFGLFQARAASLFLASATLLMTYLLGRRLLGPRTGLLAALVLATWPIAAPSAFLRTGIPLADLGRLVRYDVAVGAFGLAALLAIAAPLSSRSLPATGRCLAAGGLAGLAALSHAYGGAWLAILAAASVWAYGRKGFRTWPGYAAGAAIAAAPWIAFVLADPGGAREQNRSYAARVDLFRPGFYVENLLAEPGRFRPLLEAVRGGSPAAILFAAAAGAGLLLLAHRALSREDRGARLVVAAAGILGAGFALLLRPKMFWYLGTVWPVAALAAAAALSALVDRRRPRPLRLLVWAAVAVATAQGFLSFARLAREASATEPYSAIAATLRQRVPADGRLLLQPHWWLALGRRPGPTRSLFVPILLAHPAYARPVIPVEETLRLQPPDLLLLDDETRLYLREERPADDPGREIRRGLSAYFSSHRTASEIVLDDPAWGRLDLVHLDPLAGETDPAPGGRDSPLLVRTGR